MRLFVALDIPEDIRAKLAALPRDRKLRWVKPENLHLTLKFIGEAEPGPVEQALSTVRFDPIEIRLRGLGSFPRVFWVGVEAPESLARLAKDIEDALVPLGIAPEKRAFSPHLTLARSKEYIRKPKGDEDFGCFTVREFILYQSQLSPKGSTYTAIRRFPSA